MESGLVIAIVGGLLLFGALLVLLFTFALLRDREHSRSLAITNLGDGSDTAAPGPLASNAAKQSQLKNPRTIVGQHYVTGSDPGAVLTPIPNAAGLTQSDDPRPGRSESSGGAGLTITGFDSAGSKVYLKIDHRMLSSRRWGVTFGRDRTVSDFEVRDSDRYVSRRHFRVRWSNDDQDYQIEDLASTSGTKLNGQLITPFRFVPLRPGSTMKIGQLELDVGKA